MQPTSYTQYNFTSLLGSISRKAGIVYNSHLMSNAEARRLMAGIYTVAETMDIYSEMTINHMNALYEYTIKLVKPTPEEGASTLIDLKAHTRLVIYSILADSLKMKSIITEINRGMAAPKVCDNEKLLEVQNLIDTFVPASFEFSNAVQDYLEIPNTVGVKDYVEYDDEASISSYYE